MRPHFQPLFAKTSGDLSGGAGRKAPASAPAPAVAEAPVFRPIDLQGPKYGDLVRLKIGDQVKEGIRDPYGWFTAGHLSRLEGQPTEWAPL